MALIGELLFWSGNRADLGDVLRHNFEREVPARVERIPSADFNDKTDEELVAMVVDDLKGEPIVLHPEEDDVDVQNVQVAVEDFFSGGRVSVAGLRVTKTIPFEGEADLFKLTPNQHDMNPPYGEVRSQRLTIGIEVRESEEDAAVRHLDDTLAKVQAYIGFQRPQLDQYNEQLPGVIASAIQRRRESLGKASGLADRLRGR